MTKDEHDILSLLIDSLAEMRKENHDAHASIHGDIQKINDGLTGVRTTVYGANGDLGLCGDTLDNKRLIRRNFYIILAILGALISAGIIGWQGLLPLL